LISEDGGATDPRAAGRRGAVVALAALPWAWFPLREVSGVVGDVVAIVLPVLVVLLTMLFVGVALLVRRRRRYWTAAALSVLLMGAFAVVGPWLPADAGAVTPGASVRVAGANVQALPDAAGPLLALSPDVLAVAETTPDVDARLAVAYPHRHFVYTGSPAGGPDVAVYSRWPLRAAEDPGPGLPGVRVEVDGPAGPFVLYALHVPRPWFTTVGGYQATAAEHHAFLDRVADRVAAETMPVVAVGDLNSPDRGRDYRRLLDRGGMVDAMRDGVATFTSVAKWTPFLLRIDHLLVTDGWCGDAAARFDLPGSDHRGVTATVGPCVQ